MRVRKMFPDYSCAGAIAIGASCFFMGVVMLVWCIWDMIDSLSSSVISDGISDTVKWAIVVWLVGWSFLQLAWKHTNIRRRAAYKVAIMLVITGVTSTVLSIVKISFL
jgi:hypothetical protein